MTLTKAESFHNDLREWYKLLSFNADLVRVFQNRLTEIVNRNTRKEVLAEAEHFQNQFILQKEQFDVLLHEINDQKMQMRKDFLQDNPVVYLPVADNQVLLKDKMEIADKIFLQTKKEFYRFLSNML